jgi:hypothetical protein
MVIAAIRSASNSMAGNPDSISGISASVPLRLYALK